MPPINQVLQPLVGLPLSIARRAADMRVFHFGEVRPHPRGRGTVGAYALHVQCPWRFVSPGGVVTGSSDRFVPPRDGTDVDIDNHRAGSLQELRIAALLEGWDDVTKSHINSTAGLVVTAVSSDPYGGVDIEFSGGIRLQLFPDGSAEEDWRFFQIADEGAHFVVQGGGVVPE